MDTAPDIARAQANVWFDRLRARDCTAEDRAAFERWRAADVRHAETYAELEDLWDLSTELVQKDPDIAAVVRAARREDKPTWPRRYWPLTAVAASLIVAYFLSSTGLLTPDPPTQHYATKPGEQRTVTLEDGSVVVLDTATRLDVRFKRRQRVLELIDGRADFKVHRDATRPFIVRAGLADVTAIGTQFQIRLDDHSGQVTLLEGQVTVASRQSAVRAALSPGERVAVDAAGALGAIEHLGEADRANAEGWTLGQLVVRDWPLETLVPEVNRYGRTPLRLGDAEVGRVSVSGTFDPAAPDSLARALQYGWQVRVEHRDGEIVLYARK